MVSITGISERVSLIAARTMKEKEPSSQEMLIKIEEISPKQLLKEISGSRGNESGLANR